MYTLPRGYENRRQKISWKRDCQPDNYTSGSLRMYLDLVEGCACSIRDWLEKRVHDDDTVMTWQHPWRIHEVSSVVVLIPTQTLSPPELKLLKEGTRDV